MHSELTEKYQKLIQQVHALAHPRVLINVCSHGNETLGIEVVNKLEHIPIKTGSVVFHVANELALKQSKRFIDSDLNRSFPGVETGNYEQQIAFQMMQYIPHFDYVIDIHSTVSRIKNCLIIEDDSPEVQKLISMCQNAKTILQITATKGVSLFNATRLSEKTIPAIAFEYGDNDEDTREKTIVDIKNILSLLGVIESKNFIAKTNVQQQFECYDVYPKQETDVPNSQIKNYEIVHVGDVVGYADDGSSILSDSDFYPVLFGETNYKTMFGFKARRVE